MGLIVWFKLSHVAIHRRLPLTLSLLRHLKYLDLSQNEWDPAQLPREVVGACSTKTETAQCATKVKKHLAELLARREKAEEKKRLKKQDEERILEERRRQEEAEERLVRELGGMTGKEMERQKDWRRL